jgi:hypothetical protein
MILGINLTLLNSSIFTSQIVNHFINQNDKVQIDYLLMLASPNWLLHYVDKSKLARPDW